MVFVLMEFYFSQKNHGLWFDGILVLRETMVFGLMEY